VLLISKRLAGSVVLGENGAFAGWIVFTPKRPSNES